MENEHLPKNFEKFKIFKDLSKDIALLIKNLENNLKNRLNQNKPSSATSNDNLSKSALGSRLRKIWPFKGVLEGHRASLSDYLEYKTNLNKFLDEIVLENTGKINLIEQYDQISDIIDKFKLDALNIFTKYSKQLQPEYDKERADYIKRTEVPDPVSDEEIRAAHKSAVASSSKEIQDKNDKTEHENLDLSMETLIKNGVVNFDDKESIKKVLGDNFNEDFLIKLKNYAKKMHNEKKLESGGINEDMITPEWFAVINKSKENTEEFAKNWPLAQISEEEYKEFIKKLLLKKSEQMSDVERLQYTLLTSDENDPDFRAFMNQLTKKD
jgi:hypothetical protein